MAAEFDRGASRSSPTSQSCQAGEMSFATYALRQQRDSSRQQQQQQQPGQQSNPSGGFPGISKYESAVDDDSREMLSWLWVVRGALLDCTAHGFPKIIATDNFKRRIFWTCCTALSLVAFLVQLGFLVSDVYSYPVTMNLEVVSLQRMRFPLVTICNANKLRRSKLQQLPANHTLYKTIIFDKYNAVFLSEMKELLSNSTDQFFVDLAMVPEEAAQRDSAVECEYNRGRTPAITPPDYEYGTPTTTMPLTTTAAFGGGGFGGGGLSDDGPTQSLIYLDEFYCSVSKTCQKVVETCDGWNDCPDETDEAESLCGACSASQFNCRDGGCIDGTLRCDSAFDCEDGSDEDERYCNSSLWGADEFFCCNSLTILPEEFTCDNIKDCYGDRSDENLHACSKAYDSSGTETNWLMCPVPGDNFYSGTKTWIPDWKVGDGVPDCDMGLDEVCAWKNRTDVWINPKKTDTFEEFVTFLDYVRRAPSKTRWYAMASEEQIAELGHQFEDMVISCVFANKPCFNDNTSIALYRTVDQDFGNCFSFQVQNSVSSVGRQYGLTLLLNLEVYDSMGLLTPDTAIKLYLTPESSSNADGSLFIDTSTLISLPPGFNHDIKLQPTESHKLPSPYSECAIYGEGSLAQFLTKTQCEKWCFNRMKLAECGCLDDVSFLHILDTSLCDFTDSEARECVDEIVRTFDAGNDCSCPDACQTNSFELSFSQSEWPSNSSLVNFFTSIVEYLDGEQATEFTLNVLQQYSVDKKAGTATAQHISRTSFARLNIYFGDHSSILMNERPYFTFVTVFGNLGGLLGLYLGLSVLSILEIIDFLFDVYEIFTMKGKQKRAQLHEEKDKLARKKENMEESSEEKSPGKLHPIREVTEKGSEKQDGDSGIVSDQPGIKTTVIDEGSDCEQMIPQMV